MDIKTKKILVCGLARSGISAVKLLKSIGADVSVWDIKPRNSFSNALLDYIKDNNIGLILEVNPEQIVKRYDIIVLSPGIDTYSTFIIKAKNYGIKVIGELELGYIFCRGHIAAVTGTNGKTTTVSLLGEIFKYFDKRTKVVGNIGEPICKKAIDIDPGAPVIAEVSSFQLETIDSFRPRVACILNITPDHLDRHGDFESYTCIKKMIFKNQIKEDIAILNYDDINIRNFYRNIESRVLFFSIEEILKNGVYINNDNIVARYNDETRIIMPVSDVKLKGRHNLQNVLAAVSISMCYHVPIDLIRMTVRNFKGIEHRLEFVTRRDGVTFYNDSKATNIDSAIKSLEAMDKPVILIAGGYDKNLGFTEWVKLFNKKVKYLILIGQTSNKIISECDKHGFSRYKKASSMDEAVEFADLQSDKGDIILLSPACASYDMFKNYEERGKSFKSSIFSKL